MTCHGISLFLELQNHFGSETAFCACGGTASCSTFILETIVGRYASLSDDPTDINLVSHFRQSYQLSADTD